VTFFLFFVELITMVDYSKWDKMKYDSDSDHEDAAKIRTFSKPMKQPSPVPRAQTSMSEIESSKSVECDPLG
jgi:hypothetical protein